MASDVAKYGGKLQSFAYGSFFCGEINKKISHLYFHAPE